jgi:hypothetical protein
LEEQSKWRAFWQGVGSIMDLSGAGFRSHVRTIKKRRKRRGIRDDFTRVRGYFAKASETIFGKRLRVGTSDAGAPHHAVDPAHPASEKSEALRDKCEKNSAATTTEIQEEESQPGMEDSAALAPEEWNVLVARPDGEFQAESF